MHRLHDLQLRLCLLCLTGAMTGQVIAGHKPSTYTLDVENDVFAQTDRYYSSGARLTRIHPADQGPAWVARLTERLPLFSDPGRVGVTHAIGHNAYTPADKGVVPPDPRDRPYAGWLYGTVGIDQVTDQRLDRLQLTLGIVGPSALAHQAQQQFHSQPLRGWDSQLHDEPTLMLIYERQWRALGSSPGVSGWGMDLTPHAGGSLGTPFTFLNAGCMVRLGRDLPLDYGPPRIQPSLPGSGLFQSRTGFHWYGFAGMDLRLVGLDLFLDGNSWRESPRVDKDRYVGDLQLGFVLGFKRLRVAYTHVVRTREFRTQESRQNFGAVSISVLR